MSFSADVKEELSKINIFSNVDAVKSEIYGYLLTVNNENSKIKFLTENEYNINRLNKLLNKLKINYKIEMNGKNYLIEFKKTDFDFDITQITSDDARKAMVRGAFLGSGSITEPNIRYHLEIRLKKEARKRGTNSKHKLFWNRGKKIR